MNVKITNITGKTVTMDITLDDSTKVTGHKVEGLDMTSPESLETSVQSYAIAYQNGKLQEQTADLSSLINKTVVISQ